MSEFGHVLGQIRAAPPLLYPYVLEAEAPTNMIVFTRLSNLAEILTGYHERQTGATQGQFTNRQHFVCLKFCLYVCRNMFR